MSLGLRLLQHLRLAKLCTVSLSRNINVTRSYGYSHIFSIQSRFLLPTCSCIQSKFLSSHTLMKKEKHKVKGKSKKEDIFKAISPDELSEIVEYDVMCAKMHKTLEFLEQELMDKVNLRSSSGSYDKIRVLTADGTFHLNELAQIVQKNPKTIIINLEANPQYVKEVEKALTTSGLNVNPQKDGTTFFIPVMKITREHREQLAKSAHAFGTTAKNNLKHILAKHEKKLKGQKDLSKDKQRHVHDALLATLRKYNADVDDTVAKKEKDLLG